LRPAFALVSVGYRNHFNHPHPDVVARYEDRGMNFSNSAQSGFVDMRFSRDAPPQIIDRGRLDRHP
jgi:competence protein ComEC